jgi:DNA-binding SARP family transcriptional activator
VPAGRLADRVWGDDLPQRAQGTLHSYISRLRQILADSGGVGIARQCGGYVLTVDPLAIDLQHFAQLLAQARASRDDEQAQILFDRALGLWRGDAFAGLDTAWLNSVRYTLHQQRFAAELDHADVRLRRGQHAALLAELSGRASTYPLDERVSGQLMLALHRSGRTGDALAQYQVSRRQLAEDLGIDPGPELQRAARPAPVSRSPGWPGSCATPRAGWMHSMPVTRPPTCGPCSPGPTAP